MKPISASIKTDAGYKKVCGIVEGKYGMQLVFYAEGKQELTGWLKNHEAKNLYLNLKQWDSNPAQHYEAKSNGYQPPQDDLDQECPF